jgi:hypothetical protein
MTAILVFLSLTFGYFFGSWNWQVYYSPYRPSHLTTPFRTLLFPFSATHQESWALVDLFWRKESYCVAMAFFWPIKVIFLCAQWFTLVIAGAI